MVEEVLNIAVAQMEPAKANLQSDRDAVSMALVRVEGEMDNLTNGDCFRCGPERAARDQLNATATTRETSSASATVQAG